MPIEYNNSDKNIEGNLNVLRIGRQEPDNPDSDLEDEPEIFPIGKPDDRDNDLEGEIEILHSGKRKQKKISALIVAQKRII